MSEADSPGDRHRLMQPGRALSPFASPTFRAIWFAMLACNLGSTIQSVAAAWLMTELTASHTMVALVAASSTIPVLLFGLVAGAIADNFDRRRIMLMAQTGMFLVSVALTLVTFAGAITPPLLLSLTLLLGIGTALNAPAWQASIRMQVDHADIPQAVSLNSISFNLARSVGPSIGGIMLSVWSPQAAFALNAVSYIAILVVLARWKPVSTPFDRRPVLAAMREGLGFALRSRPLRKVLLRSSSYGIGGAVLPSLLPAVASDMPGGTSVDYGLMLGSFGLGSIALVLFVSPLRRRFGSEPIVLGATIATAVGIIAVLATHDMAVILAGTFIAGIGWTGALTSMNVAVQMRAPEWILGRCMSIYQAVTFGGMALGAWAGGTLADWRGLQFALGIAAAWMIGTLGWHWVAPMPLRDEGRVDPVG